MLLILHPLGNWDCPSAREMCREPPPARLQIQLLHIDTSITTLTILTVYILIDGSVVPTLIQIVINQIYKAQLIG